MKKIAVAGNPGNWSSEKLADTIERKTGFRLLVDPGKLSLDLCSGIARYPGYGTLDVDAIIIKKVGPTYSPDLLDRLEALRHMTGCGVRMFSDPEKIMRMLDRLSCTVTLRLGGIPMPPTVVTEDVAMALDVVENYGAAVFKPLYSTKARGMTIIEAGDDAMEKIEAFQAAGNKVMYIQKKLNLPGRDLGVSFLGGEYLATYARVSSGDSWNTTTNNGGRYQPCEPPKDIIDLAEKAQALFGLDFTCVDVVETDEGPMVFEVSAFGGFRGLLEANGIDAAERYANYVIGKLENGK